MASSIERIGIETEPAAAGDSKTIVISVDHSRHSEHALRYYHEHLRQETDRVVLVHIPEVLTAEQCKGQRMNEGEWQKIVRKEQEETEAMKAKYKGILQSLKMSADYKVVNGKPGEAIVHAAQELGALYIVLGTRGMGTVRRTVLGSVSDYVVHHTHIPVVICRQ